MFADLHQFSHHAAWRRQLEMLLESAGEGIRGRDLTLAIADGGHCMRVPAQPSSFGLLGMHERARAQRRHHGNADAARRHRLKGREAMKVLIVDDHMIIRRGLAQILAGKGTSRRWQRRPTARRRCAACARKPSTWCCCTSPWGSGTGWTC